MGMGGQTGGNVYQQTAGALQNAGNVTAGIAGNGTAPGYSPATVRQTPQLAGRTLDRYMNPYTSQVIDTTMADLNRSRQMVQNQNGQAASAAGAFGGSRHGILEAETNRGFADQAGQLAAGLRQDAFNNAQGAAQFDINNVLQTRTNNMNARNTARQFNATQMGQQQDRQLGAASQLASIGNLGFGMGQQIAGQQAQQGQQQQALQQAIINAAQGQFGGFTGAPSSSLQALVAALSGSPGNSAQSQTTSRQPGLFDLISLGLAL